MNNIKVDIKMRLLSPLMHFGDERLGTMQIMRTNKFLYEGDFIDIPVYSGNAFRGQFRRTTMRDYLEKLGIADEGISEKLYYTLFTGGSLVGGSRYEEVGDRLHLRKMCPPLALLGTALGDQILQGKMKSPIFLPVCRETADYTGIESDISFYDMLEDVFYTRKDDLKSVTYNINDDGEEKKKKDNPVQMKYEAQCLSAGSELVGTIIIENCNEVEESMLHATLKRIQEIPFIGGKSAAGHGKVSMAYGELEPVETYYNYLEENSEEIRLWVREVEGVLK
ncbi:MAG: hypothetical protein GX359_11650 [Clostridiales bacterium]|nr:hypothetical protein [Clostridiales bacterium]